MKILVAPDKFKGTLSAKEAAEAIKQGVKKVIPQTQILTLPLADGGEGTVAAVTLAEGGKFISKRVAGPLATPVIARFGILSRALYAKLPADLREDSVRKKVAIIEMAAASGLYLVPLEKRNPLYTTTYGTGELLKAALKEGVEEILVGIGGSATCDGGMGMAQALGIKFFDDGEELGFGGKELIKLRRIDLTGLDRGALKAKFIVASDVNNPLYGKKGASYLYSPQKGASPKEVEELDKGLRNFAKVVKKETAVNIAKIAGAGSSGGLGAAMVAFLGAEIRPGFEVIAELVNLKEKLKGVDLVITGEGKLDAQSVYGKVPIGVAQHAQKKKIPVLAVAGDFGPGIDKLKKYGIVGKLSLVEVAKDRNKAMRKASFYLEKATSALVSSYLS